MTQQMRREREIGSTSWLQPVTQLPVERTKKTEKEGSDTVKWPTDRAPKHAISRVEPSARGGGHGPRQQKRTCLGFGPRRATEREERELNGGAGCLYI